MRRILYSPMRLLTAALALLSLSAAATAQEIHGCIKQNGTLKVVAAATDCANNETPISWNVQGPQGEPGRDGMDGEPGGPGPEGAPGPSLRVFDATGVEIGIFVEGNGAQLRIFHEPSGTSFRLSPEGELLQPISITLYFEDASCGTAAFTVGDPDGGGFLFGSGLGFVAVENATLPTIRAMRSRLSEGGCFSQNTDVPVVPVRLISDLGLTFPLPGPLYVALPPE